MQPLSAVTVYCSSSNAVPRLYFDAAAELGTAIAREKLTLIYGGNSVGPMQALADAARAAGGRVVGVTPQLLVDKGISDTAADELVVTTTMRQRKEIMESRADAFVTLPGGLGTLEEIFEIIVARQLGYHAKPIVLLNINGYFDPLLTMLEHGIEQKFIKERSRGLCFVTSEVSTAMDHLRTCQPQPLADKWLGSNPPSAIE